MTISLVTVTLYMISMGFVSKYLYSGEVTRISGIASGCINRVNGEVSKVIGKEMTIQACYRQLIHIMRN